jgi:hypothetical protein
VTSAGKDKRCYTAFQKQKSQNPQLKLWEFTVFCIRLLNIFICLGQNRGSKKAL